MQRVSQHQTAQTGHCCQCGGRQDFHGTDEGTYLIRAAPSKASGSCAGRACWFIRSPSSDAIPAGAVPLEFVGFIGVIDLEVFDTIAALCLYVALVDDVVDLAANHLRHGPDK